MDRRRFLRSCAAGACGLCAAGLPARAGSIGPRPYAPALLVTERGEPLRASALQARTNYVFHYPYKGTPAFLLDLGAPVPPRAVSTPDSGAYSWPGGVGRGRSVVAFCAICPHRFAYPSREVSLISFRRRRALRGVQDGLIHCCADHSQFDPAKGGEVLAGPAPQPLCAVLLSHDPVADTLTAHATLGGEPFDEFFRRHGRRLHAEVGPDARRPVAGQAVVQPLAHFCRHAIRC